MKNVSDTWEHSIIFGANIQNIKGSDLNYFNVFCLNFIMNSRIPLKSLNLTFNKITPRLELNLIRQEDKSVCLEMKFIFDVLFDVVGLKHIGEETLSF